MCVPLSLTPKVPLLLVFDGHRWIEPRLSENSTGALLHMELHGAIFLIGFAAVPLATASAVPLLADPT